MSKPHELALGPERLREIFHYEPSTGVLYWKVKLSPKTRPGDVAGSFYSEGGWRRVKVAGREYAAHRVIWTWMTGAWPKEEIDHIDCVASNNVFSNLREASRLMNSQNKRRPPKGNIAGFLGVGKKRAGGFMARIGHSGKTIYLGTFDTAEEAYLAYVAAKRIYHEGCTL